MKVVYPICCGLDVHKSVVDATIAPTDEEGVTSYEQRSFKTLNPDLFALRDWPPSGAASTCAWNLNSW